QKEIHDKLITLLMAKKYEEIFIALNKHYRKLLPDLTPYAKRIHAEFSGFGNKAEALKRWIIKR
ncbi:MAG: hypothetical protein DRN06_07890, partial [Thermoprotei archaeon]